MTCDQFKPLLTGYADGELSGDQRARIEAHLESCPDCARELQGLRALKEELDMMTFKEPTDAELARYWAGVYNRLERGIGWVLLSVGAILLLCFGAFELVKHFITDPTISILLRAGVAALIVGLVVLFVSLLRERLAVRKADRYSKEIER